MSITSIYQDQENIINKQIDEISSSAESENTTSYPITPQTNNVFYIDVKVFLEGVQVPHASCSVSYGVTSPATATITIPAHSFLRELPETTKVLVVYKDLVADANGEYKWRVLFDGEMSAMSYSIHASGAQLTIHAVHTTAYLTLIQLMTLAATNYLVTPQYSMLGNATMLTVGPFNKIEAEVINNVINGKNYESMADITYLILKNLLEGYKDSSSVMKWIYSKLGSVPNGYKILDRIYGVSDKAKNAAVSSSGSTPSTVIPGTVNTDGGNNADNNPPDATGMPFDLNTTGQLTWPCRGPITSYFGPRIAPTEGASSNHKGIDIGVGMNTPIHASADGTVITSTYDQYNGNYVTIDHSNGMQTVYAHNNFLMVKAGTEVKQGQVIAYSGDSGVGNGPHCHWSVKVFGQHVDPLKYVTNSK